MRCYGVCSQEPRSAICDSSVSLSPISTRYIAGYLNERAMAPTTHRKIAFIGSHSVRKTNAVHSFAGAVGRSGHSVEVGREVVRFNPLGMNEGATPEAQLWVLMQQIQQELELRNRADVLATDRAVVDNFAYFLRVTEGRDPFSVEPLVRQWSKTYDLYVRLLPDIALQADGVRSTNEVFRNEIEGILDRVVPEYVSSDDLIVLRASEITEAFDWDVVVTRLLGPSIAPEQGPARYVRLRTPR